MEPTRRAIAARRARALPLALLAALVVGLSVGASEVGLLDAARALLEALRLLPEGSVDPATFAIVVHVRAPRLALAALGGGALGLSGGVVQGLFRNPLADPGLLGISAGAALGAALWVVVGARVAPPGAHLLVAPLAAFGGALAATSAAAALGRSSAAEGTARLLLAGIGVNALVGSLIGFLTYVASDAELRDMTFWLLGNLGGASWRRVLVVVPLVVPACVALVASARALDALSLGELEATALGVDVPDVRRRVVVATALAVGGCVAVAGPIGFVGLVVPHVARLAFGVTARVVLPAAALLGATLLLLADAVGRTVAAPSEVPTGVVTAAVGAPVFLSLLLRGKGPRGVEAP